mmetsp:Transcript_41665/g.119535  ORF Transcript_41665/g.119535 Transcript_41665/m.119535 type:complete len:275 (+) Transcript_41665:253-1077(+)
MLQQCRCCEMYNPRKRRASLHRLWRRGAAGTGRTVGGGWAERRTRSSRREGGNRRRRPHRAARPTLAAGRGPRTPPAAAEGPAGQGWRRRGRRASDLAPEASEREEAAHLGLRWGLRRRRRWRPRGGRRGEGAALPGAFAAAHLVARRLPALHRAWGRGARRRLPERFHGLERRRLPPRLGAVEGRQHQGARCADPFADQERGDPAALRACRLRRGAAARRAAELDGDLCALLQPHGRLGQQDDDLLRVRGRAPASVDRFVAVLGGGRVHHGGG